MLRKEQKLVIHFYEQIDKLNGKMGHGILRYSENPIACVIDFNQGGKTTRDLFEFGPDVPVVSNVEQALGYGGEVLVLGMAPSQSRWSRKSSKRWLQACVWSMDCMSVFQSAIPI